ncbi:MAG: DegT/DnrJ/EryC1/StrS family aminotransferase [Candidatus Hydrogenedentes bacterium]|nr:DegT/DnrJ/EryC1/StrS family aminotransferase [Candidatus Hydrogenedentota bacterium]
MDSPSIPHSRPTIGPEERAAVDRVLRSGNLAQGREVAAFEDECAAVVGRKHGVAVNSGTAALHLALIGMGVSSGDTVAMPSYACAALAQAVAWQGATPVLCDIGADNNIDPERVPDSVMGVIVPHLFGAKARLPKNPSVIEDLAHSIGGPTGNASILAIASFYATKMMTTGEGGMLLTDDEGLAELARDLRDYDHRDDFQVRRAYKMTDFQAAMGRVQLRRLPAFVARRAEIAAQYHAGLAGLPLERPRLEDSVHFRYVIATPERDALEAWLAGRGVGACRPVYRPAHHTLGGDYPRSERAHGENLSLPIYPGLTTAEASFVIKSLVAFHGAQGGR